MNPLDAIIVEGCILALAAWWLHMKTLPRRREIVGCTHKHGTLKEAVPNRMGQMTALVWECDTCPLQVPLKLDRIGRDEHGSIWRHFHE